MHFITHPLSHCCVLSMHPFIHLSLHHSYPSLSSPSHFLSLLSLQEHSDLSSASTCWYPYEELHHPQSSSSTATTGPQPHAGHAPPGQLPGPATVEAKRRPVGDAAPPLGALPPVTAGDGAVFKVTDVNESPWKQHGEINQLGFVGGGEKLNTRPTENSDLNVTLIWRWRPWWWRWLTISKGHTHIYCTHFYMSSVCWGWVLKNYPTGQIILQQNFLGPFSICVE